MIAQGGNLYLVSEIIHQDINLVLEELYSKKNEMVGLLVLADLLAILDGLALFHSQKIERDGKCSLDLDINQVHLDIEGKLKYCSKILSPKRNFDENYHQDS